MGEWERLHGDQGYREAVLPPVVAGHWRRCEELGVDPGRTAPPVLPGVAFEQVKKASIKLYAYANRFISQMTGFMRNPHIAFALFDRSGCLLKLYGGADTLAGLEAAGIKRMTDWSAGALGTSAVSVGLEQNVALEISGAWNYCRALADRAVYFAPIALEDEIRGNAPEIFGGLALLLPLEDAKKDYLMLAAAAVNDIELHIYMANTLHQVYLEEERAILTIDTNVHTGKTHILYHNASVFKLFDLPHTDLYFKPVDSLLDPPPANREFWDILQKRRLVTDLKLNLSVRGRAGEYVVTTEPYCQTGLGVAGIRFFITSPRVVSSQVSRRIGNNARLTFDDIVGEDPGIRNTIRNAHTIAQSDSNVLILGESGVGKDIFAQAIHNASKRRNRPFIAVNCAAFPRDLIASELFGYDGGAFTGSKRNGNIGKFELADTGTIFLDEIGDLPLDLQAVLLRAIEQKSFMRLGGSAEISLDVKIIAATNADLRELIDQKKFRADLYYRLSTLYLKIPPLRERRGDVIPLAEHFIEAICRRTGRRGGLALSSEAKELLRSLPWYGNVRELQNLVEGVVQLYQPPVIGPEHIREYLGLREEPPRSAPQAPETRPEGGEEVTAERIEEALRACRYNRTRAAEYLGVSRKTLYRWMERLGIKP